VTVLEHRRLAAPWEIPDVTLTSAESDVCHARSDSMGCWRIKPGEDRRRGRGDPDVPCGLLAT
jgi:hypothetical protein